MVTIQVELPPFNSGHQAIFFLHILSSTRHHYI